MMYHHLFPAKAPAKRFPANNSHPVQHVPEAPMWSDADDALFCHLFGDTPREPDRFPPLKSQREIDDEPRKISVAAYVLMFGAVGLMGLIWGIGEPLMWGLIRFANWLMGVM